jgi:chromosome segregation ATPase
MNQIECQLYVPVGDGGELVAPLPPGPVVAEDGRWSVAFAIAPDAVGERLALVPAVGGPIPFTPGDGRAERDVRVARALEDLADAEALADQLRRRCVLSERALSDFREKLVQAWAEAAELRELLDSREGAHEIAKRRERDALDVVAGLEAHARQAEDELTARRLDLEEQCSFLQAELARREAAGAGAREELAAADARFQQLQAESSEALERFDEARREAERLKGRLTEAESVARRAADASEQAGRELVEQRAKTDEASQLADVHGERLAKAERELREAREELDETRRQLAHGEEKIKTLAISEQALRQEVELLTRSDLGDEKRGTGRHSKTATPAETTTEADLRHLLAVTQRDLDEARVELNEQQARYAAVAGEAASDGPAARRTEAEAEAESAEPERPWTAIDEDLLNRITRAQEFAARN